MGAFLSVRREARRLAHNVADSLLDDRAAAWSVDRDCHVGTAVTAGNFHITIIPRLLRILDRIHLYCDGAEVWLPFLSRIRLRNAVRLFAARRGCEEWKRMAGEECNRRARSA